MESDSSDRVLESLRAENEDIRLAAARDVLKLDRVSSDLDQAVREAYARETVPWVRGALAEYIASSEGAIWSEGVVVPAPKWDARLDGLEPEVAREIINTSTRRVLHEVAAVVGRARLAAAADLGGEYQGSETASQLEFLSNVCTGLRTLSAATQRPEPVEFDLAGALTQLATATEREWLCPVHANGPGPFIVTTDRNILLVAAQNILVNAIEATQSVGPVDHFHAVVLTWGVSAEGFHATVIDRGPGPPSFLAAIRNAGVSTKTGHPGYGLATASEAMRSLGGTVQIRRNDRGGATVVMTWRELR